MCTLIVGHRIDSETPLIVGANRDEMLDRPASPPAIRTGGPIPFLAPRDDRSGGTWLGLNAAGVFAALTNRFGGPADPDRRSRGEIVSRALNYETATAAASDLDDLDPAQYNGFHLVVADGASARVVVSDGDLLTSTPLEPGFAVVTERSFGAAENPRKRRIRRELEGRRTEGAVDLADLREILGHCDHGSIEAVCVAFDEFDYGTRSSTLIRCAREGMQFLHADGPPCEVDYENLGDLAAELLEE